MNSSTSLTTGRICRQCQATFTVTPDDLAFYEKVSPIFNGKKELIPPPALCPDCRQQRRLSWRNERCLYRRPCDLCGKSIVTIYRAPSPFPVYCQSCWWSDAWDGTAHGQAFDFSKPFFPQYLELRSRIPRMSLFLKNAEGSDYCNHSNGLRNSYLCVCVGSGSENVYYSQWILSRCKDICDSYQMTSSELCYEGLYADHNYRCAFVTLTNDSRDSAFLYDCAGCSNCFLCWNLRHKSYCIGNEQLSKEEYGRRMSAMDFGSHAFVEQTKKRFDALTKEHAVRKALRMEQCENCHGDFLLRCKNTLDSFDSIDLEDCRYCYDSADAVKDCYDVNEVGFHCELQCDSQSCDTGTRVLFSHVSYDVSDVLYVDSCHNASHLFGCIGLKRKQYCILNEQYAKEEYEQLAPKIIGHMRTTGEYGEFFPVTMSPFAYNETAAMRTWPKTKEEIEAKGWQWRELTDDTPKVAKLIPASQLPDSIDDVPDDILNWAIECEATRRPFKVIKQELDFYRTMRLPVPRLHPDERFRLRMARRNPRKFWTRPCMKCGKEIETTYAPERPEIVYCEECYLNTVY